MAETTGEAADARAQERGRQTTIRVHRTYRLALIYGINQAHGRFTVVAVSGGAIAIHEASHRIKSKITGLRATMPAMFRVYLYNSMRSEGDHDFYDVAMPAAIAFPARGRIKTLHDAAKRYESSLTGGLSFMPKEK